MSDHSDHDCIMELAAWPKGRDKAYAESEYDPRFKAIRRKFADDDGVPHIGAYRDLVKLLICAEEAGPQLKAHVIAKLAGTHDEQYLANAARAFHEQLEKSN